MCLKGGLVDYEAFSLQVTGLNLSQNTIIAAAGPEPENSDPEVYVSKASKTR